MKYKKVVSLVNSLPDFEYLKDLYKKEKHYRVKIRLQILCQLKMGHSVEEISKNVMVSKQSIRYYLKIFILKDYIGLLEMDGRGRYPKLSKNREEEFKKDVIRIQEEREGGRAVARDFQQLLAEKYEVEYSLNSIYVLLSRLNFSWITARAIHPKTDMEAIKEFKRMFPDMVEELVAQKNWDMKNLEIWWQDEMRVGQQGTLTRVWGVKGSRPRVVKQKQFISAYIFGASCPESNKVCSIISPYANSDAMQVHLREISKQVKYGKNAILLLDRAGWHLSEQIQIPQNIAFLPLPPYSPELNAQERVWEDLRKSSLSNRSYKDYEEIVFVAAEACKKLAKEVEASTYKLCYPYWSNLKK